MNQVKPVVAGYKQVGFNGKPYTSFASKFLLGKACMIATAKCDFRDTGGIKSRFRVIYA